MDDLTADRPCPTANFAPIKSSWPPKWTKQMVFDAICVTFGLFAEPTEEAIIKRLKEIESDHEDYPCKALRRVFNIEQPAAFTDDLIERFQNAYPECEKSRLEIFKALAFEIKTKRNITFQANLEDQTRTKEEYIQKTSKKPEDFKRQVVRYPRIIIVDDKKAPGQDRSTTPYTGWLTTLGCVEAPKDKQNDTVVGHTSPPRQDTPTEEQSSTARQNDKVIDRISQPRQDTPTEEQSSTARQNDKVIGLISRPRQNIPIVLSTTPEQIDTVIGRVSPPRQDTPDESSPMAKQHDTADTLIGSPSTKKWIGPANPYWRLPGLEYPKGTWQPADGHGNPETKNFLLFDPRGPPEVITARVYTAGEEHLMVFPIYVDLSDRAFGHVVRSMLSYRLKARFWPHDFRKDGKISSNHKSKGAGYFFVDGRVGAVDNVTLLGAGFEGAAPKAWNLLPGGVKLSNLIHDQAPSRLAITNCYINQPIPQDTSKQFPERNSAITLRRQRSPSPPGSSSSGRCRKSAKTEGSLDLINKARTLMTVVARRAEEKLSNDKDWKEAWDTFSFLSGVQQQPDQLVMPFRQLGAINKSSSPSILKYTTTGQLLHDDNTKTGVESVVEDEVGGSDSDSIKSNLYANSVAGHDCDEDMSGA